MDRIVILTEIKAWTDLLKKSFHIICILLGSLVFASGQEPPFNFTHYTIENGLAHNHCYSVVKDTFGFLWIGTENGLSRFDGHDFKNYNHREDDNLSIGGNWVRKLVLDNTGTLWAGCMRGGINRYDSEKDLFTSFKNPSRDSFGLAINELSTIYTDSEGLIWFGTFREGFGKLNRKGPEFTVFPIETGFKNPREAWSKNTVFSMIEDISDRNILWICNQASLYRFNKTTGHLVLESTLESTQNSSIHKLYMDTPGELWAAFWGAGIARYDIATGRWTHYIHDLQKFKEGDGYSNVCLDIEKKSADEFWVACGLDGLGIFDKLTGTFRFFELPNTLEPNTKSGFAFDVFVNEKDGIWICDQINGLYQIDPSRQLFRHVSTKIQKKGSREGLNRALDFAYSPSRNRYFVATGQGDGLYIYDKNLQLLATAPSSSPSQYSYQQFVAVHVDQKSRVWVIDWLQKMLLQYDEKTRLCHPVRLDQFDAYPDHDITLSGIAEDKEGNLWLSSNYGGVLKYDPDRKTLERFTGTDSSVELTDKAQVTQLFIARDGKIWLGTVNYGVYIFDPSSKRFTAFPYLGSDRSGLAEDRIQGICQDSTGRIWVGFYTKGIQLIDPDAGPEQPRIMLTQKDGLLNEKIVSIVADAYGDMWVQTQGGVFRYHPADRQFIHYSNKEGLKGYLKPYGFKALATGEICIGEAEGFYLFDPSTEYRNTIPPSTRITSFKVGESEYALDRRIDLTGKLKLTFDQNFFTLHFSALNFQIPEKNQYAYMLEGLDPDWVYSGFRHYASYTNVREGSYRFLVKAANNDGKWCEPGPPLLIVIQAPWYRTTVAYLIYAMLLLGLAVTAILYQRKRWELKTQLKLREEEARRLKELDHTKSRIFANITHEFRTPLTVIQGMSDQILQDPKDDLEERIRIIKRNSKSLLQLINQMLELSKLESGNLSTNFVQDDITKHLGYLTESFHSFANDKGIHLNFYAETSPIEMDYDPDIIDRILTNLISNALRFTPEFGKVLVVARVSSLENRPMLEFEVRDNGIGISREELDKIFDRFYQADSSATRKSGGTGIGLALVNELVRLVDGEILVESELNQGTRFIVRLPIRNTAVLKHMHPPPEEQAHPPGTKTSGAHQGALKASREKPVVLIIEDNPDVVYYLKSILASRYLIHHANNGLSGMEKAFEIIPDLIISDVMMPGMDGFQLCEKLKNSELTSHVPLIILTAKASREDLLTGLKTGADAYLNKPFSKEELLIRVENLIETREQIRHHYAGYHQHQLLYNEATAKEVDFIRKLNKIIEENMGQESFDVVRLSRLIGMSRSQLHRKIKAVLDNTPALYIRLVRLEKARSLLKKTSKSISEIAFETGFSSPSYFTYSFSETYGESPSEFRERTV